MFTKTLVYFLCFPLTILSKDSAQKCADGKFGHECFYDCNCVDNKCGTNGLCVGTECKDGWSGPTCQRRNVALNRKVTQSPYETKRADNVIDGNYSTYSETFGSPPYLYVDYGTNVKIDVLKIWYINRPSMKVCYTDDLDKFKNKSALYTMSYNCYTSYTSPQTYTMTKNARYIVIFPKEKKPTALMVTEIEAKQNFLSAGKVNMKPTPSKRHPARFAIDGNRYSYAESGGNDTAWIINLGRFCKITSVELRFRNIKGKKTYELYISNSTDIYDGKADDTAIKHSISLNRYITKTWTVKVDPPAVGQYITFLKKGKGLLKLYDIKALEALKPVAAKQTAYEFHYKANLAVDGKVSTFSQTLGKQPYLGVDLGNVTEILSYSVDIALKDEDYELCVSENNSALYTGGNTKAILSDTCWNTTRLNTTWEIQEHGYGRYVSLTSLSEGFLTLKELQIYVCSKGTYGSNCSTQCGNCKDHDCDSLIGKCSQGCAYGLTGKSCTDACPHNCICNGSTTECDLCRQGWFGAVCDQPCPSRCSRSCNKSTGMCVNCSPGFFGTNCNKHCPDTCNNQSGCDKMTGVCRACHSEFYGEDCKTKCPQYCDSLGCKRDTGECFQCKAGFQGNDCAVKCPDNCNELGCDIETGFCYGCKLGYAGAKCMTVCNTSQDECIECSKDARSCLFNCSENCYESDCNKTTGDCFSCNKGYYGEVCDTKCSSGCEEQGCFQNGTCRFKCKKGFYGMQCFKKCSENCNEKGCLRTQGDCIECKVGYFGKFCTEKCPNNCGNEGCNLKTKFCLTCRSGYFGNSCNKSCPNQCDKQGCEISSGQCYRCKAGFYGNMCKDRCSNNCNYDGCAMENGQCYGCKMGYFGADCKQLCPAACSAQGCSKDNGVCFNCLLGKFGDKCDKDCHTQCIGCSKQSGECFSCRGGYYGSKCLKQCPNNCNSDGCNTLGNCYKCKDGYYGIKCDMSCAKTCAKGICEMNQGICISCNNGFFGNECNKMCPSKCSINSCNQQTGNCNDCLLGFYGNNCNIKCPENCDRHICNKVSGNCVGCKIGFYGNKCEKVCSDDCDSRGCKSSTGECWQKINKTVSYGNARTSAQVGSDSNEVHLLGPILGIALLNAVIIIIGGILLVYYIQRRRYDSNYKRFDNERVNNPTFNWASTDISSPDKEASA